MASNRRKQDDKHLKILRNLVSLPGNKQCFDCNQRGPTYVNVTIGSFVCTTCSGLLRGLTPPHRIKSISVATFTPEEIETLQSRGNEYCRKIWLALYDSNNIQNTKDEHLVRDFMVAKYEKKLYYLEPSAALKNGNVKSSLVGQSLAGANVDSFKTQHSPDSSLISSPPNVTLFSPNSRTFHVQPSTFVTNKFNFTSSDVFGAMGSQTVPHKDQIQKQQQQSPPQPQPQQSFANFDNNPIFNSSPNTPSSFPTLMTPSSVSEDKYAALKDLDCLMKMQQESSQPQGIQGNGWLSNNVERNPSLNPFIVDIGNNNSINPFRSGLVQLTEQALNNNGSTSCNISNSSNVNDPWGRTSPTSNSALSVTQSVSFPTLNWNGKANLNMVPSSSNNPFL